MSKLWFTSDLHFSQQRTLDLSMRPFANVKEMDFIIMNNWNTLVKPEDTIFILGDFGVMKILPFLNGNKVLIKGNYERNLPGLLEGYENQFKEIYEEKHMIQVNKGGKEYIITMAHEPSRVKNIPIDDTHINLFGHVHKLCMVKPYGLNVGTDCHNYDPISLDRILIYHDAILNYYDEDVFY